MNCTECGEKISLSPEFAKERIKCKNCSNIMRLSYVYVLEQIDYPIGNRVNRWYKIGMSDNPKTRLRDYRTTNPNKIRIIHLEAYSKRKLATLNENLYIRRLKRVANKSNREWVYTDRKTINETFTK